MSHAWIACTMSHADHRLMPQLMSCFVLDIVPVALCDCGDVCGCHRMIWSCSHLSVDFSAGLGSALPPRSVNRSQLCSMCGLACMHALHWWRLHMFTCRRTLSSVSPMHVCGFVALQPKNNTCQTHKIVSGGSKLCKFFVEIHYRFVVCPSIAGGAHPPVQL